MPNIMPTTGETHQELNGSTAHQIRSIRVGLAVAFHRDQIPSVVHPPALYWPIALLSMFPELVPHA
jgi:hypothetical protein